MTVRTVQPQALVIDDSASEREILGSILRRLGLGVTLAADASSALALLSMQPQRFDVVFVDMVMESMPGVEVIRRIRTHWPECVCSIVPMSATMTRAIAGRCHQMGAGPLTLPKPFRLATTLLVLELLRLRPPPAQRMSDTHAGGTLAPVGADAAPPSPGELAHEFNNLLGIIIGSIDIALQDTLPAPVRSMLIRASDAALRGAEISASLRREADQANADPVIPYCA